MRVLGSRFLRVMGLGYPFGLAYLHLIEVKPDAKHGIGVVPALIRKYCGQRYTTGLDVSLEGAVPEYVTATLSKEIVQWIRQNEWGQSTSHEAT
jgi:hypothetical protein